MALGYNSFPTNVVTSSFLMAEYYSVCVCYRSYIPHSPVDGHRSGLRFLDVVTGAGINTSVWVSPWECRLFYVYAQEK